MLDGVILPAPPPELVNGQAEMAVLGALCTVPDLAASLPAELQAEHFAVADHPEIFRALLAAGPSGLLGVVQSLALDDADLRQYIGALPRSVISLRSADVCQYAKLLTDLHRRRQLMAIASSIQHDAVRLDDGAPAAAAIARAMNALDALAGAAPTGRPAVSLDNAMAAALQAAEEAQRRGGPVGLSTGFRSVDDLLGGLEPGTLHLLAGRPGMGKSALGLAWALHIASQGVGTLAISLEMSAVELGRRALSAAARVPVGRIKRGDLSSADAAALIAARKRLQGMPLTIEDAGGLTPAQIALKARAARRRHGLGLIVVDHLHIVKPDDADARQGPTHAIGAISTAAKRLAKDFAAPVLLLAQLNRGPEGRDDKRPNLADLRQSGTLEQDADTVMFVYRPEYYLKQPERRADETDSIFESRRRGWHDQREQVAGRAELIVAKNRDGALGTAPLRFDGATTSFSEEPGDVR